MTDTDYGISDDVLNRAAEAMYRSHPLIAKSGAEEWDNLADGNRENWIGMVRAALPVLIPEVRDDATRRIKAWICQRAVTSPSDAYNEGYQDALADLWEYLSATEEREGARCS